MKKLIFLLASTLFAAPIAAAALAALPSAGFTHHDWELACENTRTCRAAGYQPADATPAVSVLLTRAAGPRQPVAAQLQLGHYGDDVPTPSSSGGVLNMKINGRSLGTVKVDPKTMIGDLSPKQVQELVAALTRPSMLEWFTAGTRWIVSSKGAAAVLLKMDEFQGRLDTPGALVRKGSKSEDSVLPPLPVPAVVVAAVPDSKEQAGLLSSLELPTLLRELRRSAEDDECEGLANADNEADRLEAFRLSEKKLLVATTCRMAAYNEAKTYWVINSRPPYAPVAVTWEGSDYGNGTITASQKGRGLGDCWTWEGWTWNGDEFVHTSSGSTGMCRLVAPGGAWALPLLVTREVKRPGK